MGEREGCVYVISAVDKNGNPKQPVKIGITENPWGRLATIQTSCPFEIKLLHYLTLPNKRMARDLERMFHELHAKERSYGEWFNIDPIKALQIVCLDLELLLTHWTDLSEEERAQARVLAGLDAAKKIWKDGP